MTSYAAMVSDHEQQRPALRHIDLQRLPAEGVATEKSLVEFHEHEPERPRQRDRVDETGAETGSDRGGGGDRERFAHLAKPMAHRPTLAT